MRRLLGTVGFGFFLVLIADNALGFNFAVASGALFLAAAVILCFRPAGVPADLAGIPFAAFAACVLYCVFSLIYVTPARMLDGTSVAVSATVESTCSQTTGGFRYTVKSGGENGKIPSGSRILLFSEDYIECLPGDEVCFTAEFYSGDEIKSLYSEGIYYLCSIAGGTKITVSASENPGLIYRAARMRYRLSRQITESLPGDEASLINGMTFGSDYLTDELYSVFKYIGVSHLFAVSGLHVAIVGQIIMMLFSFFGVKRRLSAPFCIAAVWIFAAVAGFPLSALRACIMFTVYMLGLMLFRSSDAFNSLGFACAAVTLFSPFSAINIGLLSSVSSCLGLILLSRPLYRAAEKHIPKLGSVKSLKFTVSSLCATAAAVIGLLPCAVLYYGNLSLLTPVSNLILIPLSYAVLFFSVAGGMLSLVPGLNCAAPLMYLAGGAAARVCVNVGRVLNSVPYANAGLGRGYLGVWTGLCLVGVAAAVILYNKTRDKAKTVFLCVSVCVAMFISGAFSSAVFNSGVTDVIVCDVGTGVCIAVCSGKNAVVVGCSGSSAARSVSLILRARGITRVSSLVTDEDASDSQVLSMCSALKTERLYTVSRTDRISELPGTVSGTLVSFSPWDGCVIEYDTGLAAVTVTAGSSRFAVSGKQGMCAEQSGELCAAVIAPGVAYDAPDIRGTVFVVSSDGSHGTPAVNELLKNGKNAYMTGGEGSIIMSTRGRGDINIRRLRDA